MGVGADEFGGGMAGVSRDATSLIYCPSTLAQWNQTMAVAGIASGAPSASWGLQDASGNPVDSIGSFTLTATGAVSYQQAVSGWTRTAITMPDAASDQLVTTSASLPNLASASVLILLYAKATGAPAVGRNFVTGGTGTTPTLLLQTSKIPQTKANTNTANGAVAIDTAVNPCVLKYDKTNSVVTGYTLADKMTPTFAASTGQKITLGPNTASSNSPPMAFLYAAAFFSAAAELTDAQIKKLMQTLGWTPTWT